MGSIGHTYAPNCLLHAQPNAFTPRASEASAGPPPIVTQFFYCSSLPIDDPLAAVPPPASNAVSKPARLPPQPFSIHDNAALEASWLALLKAGHDPARSRSRSSEGSRDGGKGLQTSRSIPRKISAERKGVSRSKVTAGSLQSLEEVVEPQAVEKTSRRGEQTFEDTDSLTAPAHVSASQEPPITEKEVELQHELTESQPSPKRRRSRSPFSRRNDIGSSRESRTGSISSHRRSLQSPQKGLDISTSPTPDKDTSGTPFLRIPSRLSGSLSRSPLRLDERELSCSRDGLPELPQADGEEAERPDSSNAIRSSSDSKGPISRSESLDRTKSKPRGRSSSKDKERLKASITVGASRLHFVQMPGLQMRPMYWDPVHDISSVVRGTWFYKDTMWPVESDLANRIEEGYEYVKPWTATYIDELNSCQAVGPEAELRLVHQLWPTDEPANDQSRPTTARGRGPVSRTDKDHSSDFPDFKSRRKLLHDRAAGALDGFDDAIRLFGKSSLIFANEKEAQILRPNQLPSAARGRSPLTQIRKGRAVGIPVVRGFDVRAWEALYPPRRKIVISSRGPHTSRSGRNGSKMLQELPPCEACLSPAERPKPTDLVFVIHGIGQKLSERVESFHFTHAINAFRRQVNVEAEADTVKPWLRAGLGSIMVLPVNWRSKIQIDGGEPGSEIEGQNDASKNPYTLKDITVDTIPAVRNLMSDVLLDIPFYLSQHKSKMIEAVTKEANRIYRLWCTNNPGFREEGRVHILAHSLGSVMTLDILSKQPTKLPAELDTKSAFIRTDMFEFETSNLFFLGSPAGLFLFIEQASLLPRKGREKPGAEGLDTGTGVAGEVGTYGCLAVDNLYNVLHHIDPVAYQLNACVDLDYAASLQRAFIPSTAVTWAQYFGLARPKTLGAPKPSTSSFDNFSERPAMQTMPSTVEMEIHDFTREEIAEKRMQLLNDNGQVDFTLSSGTGPLEIQYLNMLGAHSSYWISQDFVRFLVVEVGRKPGRAETVTILKATKKRVRGRKLASG